MTDPIPKAEANDLPPSPQPVRDETMSRWGDDGGTVPLPEHAGKAASPDTAPERENAERVPLHVRVIALESLLVALLADVSEGQLARLRKMAAQITPQAGLTPHPLTAGAAAQMASLLHRAEHWDRGTAA